MRRYDDPIIHYSAAVLLIIGLFSIFSGFSIPRLVYYSVYQPDNWKAVILSLKPFINLFIVLSFGGFVYLLLSRGVSVKRVFGRKLREKTVVYGLTAVTLFLMAVVVLEKFIFHMRFNRWLLAPKHMILITGLTITAYFLYLSYQFAKEKINWKETVVVSLLFLGLLGLQPDVGTSILFVASFALLFFMKTTKRWVRYLFGGSMIFFLLVIIFSIINARLNLQIPNPFPHSSLSHVIVRINNWLNPFHDVTDKSYQIANSLYAVHKGGLVGVGYGFGTRKLYMGATVHTDFIFATIGEELGFIFSVFIFLVTALLVFRLLEISYRFKSNFEKFFTLLVALETFAMAVMNAGMAVNLLPSKGWPYPLISYGPFFTVFYVIQLGIVQFFLNRRFYEVYAPRSVKKRVKKQNLGG